MPHRPRTRLGWLSGKGLVAIVLWGVSFVLTRFALESFSPFGLVSIRLVIGTLVLLVAIRSRGGSMFPDRADIPICALLGVVLAVHLLIQAFGLQYTTAINTGWIIGFIPITIALGSCLFLRQRIEPAGWCGIVLGAAGVFCVTMSSPPNFEHARFGDMLQIASCLTWTLYTLVGARPVARSGAMRVTAFAMAVAAVVSTLPLAWTGAVATTVTVESLLAVGFLGFLCSGVALYLWFEAMSEHGPPRVGALLYIEPFVTLGAAALLLREPVTVNVLWGGACVLTGVWLVSRGVHSGSAKSATRGAA